ncbi:YgaP family membrane protein [Aeromonas jandaei]|uniref:YgaP family membrane protein n=1 Tax=Aeromonas jandaei TaxID=650 RepID=UPI003EC4BA21
MTVDNGVRIVAGCMLLLSLILTAWVHPSFVWLSAFVGVNLIQSAFTGFCPAAIILRRLGFK